MAVSPVGLVTAEPDHQLLYAQTLTCFSSWARTDDRVSAILETIPRTGPVRVVSCKKWLGPRAALAVRTRSRGLSRRALLVLAVGVAAVAVIAVWGALSQQDPAVAPPASGAPRGTAGTCSIDPADGQSAIEAAIAACPDGRTVMFPAGRTYRQTDRIRVERREGLVIDGNGSTFIKTSANDGQRARPNWELLEDSNVTLQNMVIRGALQPGPRGITPGNQFDHGVIVYGGDGVTVRDVKVYDVFGDFVTTAPSGFVRGGGALGGQVPRNIAIQRLDGRGAARMCIGLTGGIGLRVEDSKLSDCRYGGIDIETDVAGEPLRDVHIVRNTIAGYYLFAIGIAGPVDTPPKPGDIDDIEIRDNVTTTPSDTCWASVNAERGPISGVVVAGNSLKTMNRGVNLESVSSGSVSANKVEITVSPGLCGPPAAIPVRITKSPQVAVSNNTFAGY